MIDQPHQTRTHAVSFPATEAWKEGKPSAKSGASLVASRYSFAQRLSRLVCWPCACARQTRQRAQKLARLSWVEHAVEMHACRRVALRQAGACEVEG
eukprot:2201018-Rhodomonas_salina.1